MAFVTKYTIEQKNRQTGNIWRAHIQEDGATFDSNITPSLVPFEIDYRCNTSTPDWIFASSVATVRFVDDDTGVLSSLFTGGTDERYKLLITEDTGSESTIWTGFVDTDSYQYGYLTPGIGEIQATDHLRTLKNVAYEQSAGVPYTGQERFATIISRCLANTNIGIGIATHSSRYSFLSSNALDDTPGSSNDPLWFHTIDQSVYLDSEGNSLSCWDVLEDICKAWGLQIFQAPMGADNRWCVFERRRIIQAVSPFFYDTHLYTTAGAKDSPLISSGDGKVGVSLTSSSQLKFVQGATIAAEPPIGSASYIYQHGKLEDIFTNLDFETIPVLSTGWTADAGWLTTNDAQDGAFALKSPVDWSTTPDTQPTLKLTQSAPTSISAATNYRIRLSAWLNVPDRNDLPSGRELYWYWSYKIGTKYWRWSDTTWQDIGVLTDQQILNPIPIHNYIQGPGWNFQFQTISNVLDGLSGTMTFQIREAVEKDPGSGSQTQNDFYVDSIMIELLDENDNTIKIARQSTSSINGTTNGPDETIQVRIGQGPLDVFPGAIRQKDSTDTDVALAENWSHGTLLSANSVSFDRFNCDERITQYREPARTISGTVISAATVSSAELNPTDQILVERPDSTTQDDYMWYKGYTWRPANPESLVTAAWCQIQDLTDPDTHAVVNLDDLSGTTGIRSYTSIVSLSGTGTLDVVDNESDLQALTVGDSTNATVLHNYTTSTDKGGGVFIKDSGDSSTTTDDITVFASTDSKRIKRVGTEQPWPVQWAGAKGDGTTDDATALSDIITAAAGGAITLPPGRYVVDSTITIDGQALSMIGQQSSYYKDDGRTGFPTTPSGAVIMSGSSLTGPIFIIQDTTTTNEEFSPVHFENIHFIGNGTTDTHAIQIIGGSNVQVKNCNVTGFTSDGIKAETSTVGNTNQPVAIKIVGCTLEGNGAHGASLDCQSSIISDNIAANNTTGGMLAVQTSTGNKYLNNTFSNNTGYGLKIEGVGGDTISKNLASGNGGAGIFVGHATLLSVQTVTDNNLSSNGTDTGLSNEDRSGLTLRNMFASTITGNTSSFNGTYGFFLTGIKQTRLIACAGTGNTLDLFNTRTQNVTGVYNAIEHGALQAGNNESLNLTELISTAAEGSVLELPHGDYLLESSVAIDKALTIRGQATKESTGTKGTRIVASASLDNPCFVVSVSGVKIERINFIGDSNQTGNAHGVEWTGGSDGELRHCVIKNFVGTGLRINSGVTDITAYDVRVDSCDDKGMFIQGDDCIVDRCKVTGNGTIGILTTNADDLIISRSFISSNGTDGIQMQGGFHNIVTDCHIKLNDQNGVNIRSGDNHSVQGCHINCNGADTGATTVERAGVYVREGNKHQVNNNHIGDNQASATQLHAVATGDLLNSAHIIGNTGEGNATAYFNLDSTSAGDLDIDLDHTETIDLASLGAGASTTQNVTITGARGGDRVTLGPPTNWDMDVQFWGFVSANDTLTIKFHNISGGAINQASGDWKIGLSRREGATASVPAPTGLTALTIVNLGNTNLLTQAD